MEENVQKGGPLLAQPILSSAKNQPQNKLERHLASFLVSFEMFRFLQENQILKNILTRQFVSLEQPFHFLFEYLNVIDNQNEKYSNEVILT